MYSNYCHADILFEIFDSILNYLILNCQMGSMILFIVIFTKHLLFQKILMLLLIILHCFKYL